MIGQPVNLTASRFGAANYGVPPPGGMGAPPPGISSLPPPGVSMADHLSKSMAASRIGQQAYGAVPPPMMGGAPPMGAPMMPYGGGAHTIIHPPKPLGAPLSYGGNRLGASGYGQGMLNGKLPTQTNLTSTDAQGNRLYCGAPITKTMIKKVGDTEAREVAVAADGTILEGGVNSENNVPQGTILPGSAEDFDDEPALNVGGTVIPSPDAELLDVTEEAEETTEEATEEAEEAEEAEEEQ